MVHFRQLGVSRTILMPALDTVVRIWFAATKGTVYAGVLPFPSRDKLTVKPAAAGVGSRAI
jgi:hypothetical protein